MNRRQLLRRLDAAWAAFQESYTGLSDAELMERGVTGDWSVRDILAHVSTWEEEALKHLPLILEGGTPPRYSVAYGGIDAFNARMTAEKAHRSLSAVRRELDETHRRLVDFVQAVPPGAAQPRGALPSSAAPRHVRPLPAARRGDPGVATQLSPNVLRTWSDG